MVVSVTSCDYKYLGQVLWRGAFVGRERLKGSVMYGQRVSRACVDRAVRMSGAFVSILFTVPHIALWRYGYGDRPAFTYTCILSGNRADSRRDIAERAHCVLRVFASLFVFLMFDLCWPFCR